MTKEGKSPVPGVGSVQKGQPGSGGAQPDQTSDGCASSTATCCKGEQPSNGADDKSKLDRHYDKKVLSLAKGSLAVIAVLGVLGAGLYVWSGWGGDGDAAEEVFEFVKVGLLPLAVMILTYYFAKQRRAEGGEGPAGKGGGGSSVARRGESKVPAGSNDSDEPGT